MKILIIGLIVVFVLLLIVGSYFMRLYNNVKVSSVAVEEAFAGVDTFLEERFDLLTKLASTAKEEARLEKDLIETVIKLRTNYEMAQTINEKIKIGEKVDNMMPQFQVTREQYPNPNFNEAFRQVQMGIARIEDKLSAARRNYNATVGAHNKLIVVFPANIVASIFRFEQQPMFQASEGKREDVNLDNIWAN